MNVSIMLKFNRLFLLSIHSEVFIEQCIINHYVVFAMIHITRVLSQKFRVKPCFYIYLILDVDVYVVFLLKYGLKSRENLFIQ